MYQCVSRFIFTDTDTGNTKNPLQVQYSHCIPSSREIQMHFLPRALCCLTPIKIKRNFAGNQHDVISWYLITLHTHVVAVHGSWVSNNWNRNPSLPPWGIWYHEVAIEWSLATRLNVHETASGGVDLALRLWWKWPSAAGLCFDHWPSRKGWRVMVKVEGWQIHCACIRLSDTNPPYLHRWDFLSAWNIMLRLCYIFFLSLASFIWYLGSDAWRQSLLMIPLINCLGGGFKYVSFSPLLGEDSHFD